MLIAGRRSQDERTLRKVGMAMMAGLPAIFILLLSVIRASNCGVAAHRFSMPSGSAASP